MQTWLLLLLVSAQCQYYPWHLHLFRDTELGSVCASSSSFAIWSPFTYNIYTVSFLMYGDVFIACGSHSNPALYLCIYRSSIHRYLFPSMLHYVGFALSICSLLKLFCTKHCYLTAIYDSKRTPNRCVVSFVPGVWMVLESECGYTLVITKLLSFRSPVNFSG